MQLCRGSEVNVPIDLCTSKLIPQLVVYIGEVTEPLRDTLFPKGICHSGEVLKVYNCAPFPLLFCFLCFLSVDKV